MFSAGREQLHAIEIASYRFNHFAQIARDPVGGRLVCHVAPNVFTGR